MNSNSSRNNKDARQNLKITFKDTDYQNPTKTYAGATSPNNFKKHMVQTNTQNMNQQPMEQRGKQSSNHYCT